MTQEPPPMSPVLRALVDADQQRPGPSVGDRKRVYAALGVSLGVLPAGAIVAAHAASASAAASATVTTAAGAGSSTAVATAVGAASTVGPLALLAKAPLLSVGVGALLGAALTAYVVKGPAARWTASARAHRDVATSVAPATPGATARVATPPAPPSEAPAPAAEEPSPVVAATALPGPTKAPVIRHVAAVSVAKNIPTARAADEPRAVDTVDTTAAVAATPGILAAEQALLDPARAALAHDDGAAALARLSVHERRFPNGALAQEREAMTIRALALTGDHDRAQRRADAFRARYPGSLLWPMIAATLDAPPGPR